MPLIAGSRVRVQPALFGTVSAHPKYHDMTKQNEKTPAPKTTDKKTVPPKHQTEELGSDYWDRIANDVASGYESKEDVNDVLNTDQEADDHTRGDAGV
ncbi:hypothetical protein SAMN05444008_112120 [Cnuella takakiae]|uniref:Uncharacterized protein n=1 Tax=Cnuella takakiae TaxID=1302690 RepID=A0A1M5EP14_9BACT|nr:hypothetical protein [Cnuella takakiae]OLY91245.1 hypothetical protein BUE76_04505 [Cnuella takakiae]SHF80850.1 hypothetical protein SAMN05444008_112120 [Cnuella takakiae]